MASSTGGVSRPFGVTLIAFVTLLAAVVPLLQLARAPAGASATQPAERPVEMRRWAQLAGMWGAVGLLTAAGLFGMRRWGWWLALVYYSGSILLLVMPGLQRGTATMVDQVGLSVLVVWYLTTREIRTAFRRH